jgi:type II secretory pathway pseudopilin PulG
MARGLRGFTPAFTILELLFALAIAGTLTTIAVPQGLRALDDFRTRAAARYLAQRLADARLSAVKRSLAQGLRFEPGSPDYRITAVADGNANGLRTAEIQAGIDRTLPVPEVIGSLFEGVAFGILDNVPDADGQAANGTAGVRVGSARLLAMNPDGTSSSGTLYLRGRDRAQYAVRVLGVTGRVRMLRFDHVRRRWIDQ